MWSHLLCDNNIKTLIETFSSKPKDFITNPISMPGNKVRLFLFETSSITNIFKRSNLTVTSSLYFSFMLKVLLLQNMQKTNKCVDKEYFGEVNKNNDGVNPVTTSFKWLC